MNLDWLQMYQDYPFELPQIGDFKNILYDTVKDEIIGHSQPSFKQEGSFSTSIQIRISGARITVSGNPSKYSRLDNLVGFQSIDVAVKVYNRILLSLGLPPFTKCTFVKHREFNGGIQEFSDGATITRIDINTNLAVGENNVKQYLKGISTLRYRNSIPMLHTNGATVNWQTPRHNASRHIYPKVYCKATEIELFTLPKIKRKYGEDSEQYEYVLKLFNELKRAGVVRFEQEFKSDYLRKKSLRHYGMVSLQDFGREHADFLNLPKKLTVEKMDIVSISQQLIDQGICKSTYSARITAGYSLEWMNGVDFKSQNKTQIDVHRARLRKIGLDIFDTFDASRHSPVVVREAKLICTSFYNAPSWYKRPSLETLQLKAVN